MATRLNARLHILHLSTQRELSLLSNSLPLKEKRITGEVCVHHLWFHDGDYALFGNRIKWNPAIKTLADRTALRAAVNDDTIDIVATDHAPHLLSEKEKPYLSCPSGVPSVQQSLPVAFTIGIPLTRIAAAYSEIVAEIFGIADRGILKQGAYADLVVVDPEEEFTVKEVASKCSWSPYEGQTLKGAVKMVWVNGVLTAKDGAIVSDRSAKALYFK